MRETLALWGYEHLRHAERIRLLASESLHVTLCFLGGRGAAEVDGIAAACRAAAAHGHGETPPPGGPLSLVGSPPPGGPPSLVGSPPPGGPPSLVGSPPPGGPLSLGEVLWLPPRRPRVVAVQVLDGDGALGRLQSELSRVLQAGGWYEPERRPFNPHITVARLGRDRDAAPSTLTSPSAPSFAASAVTLYRSRTGPGGARYEPLERIALDARGA